MQYYLPPELNFPGPLHLDWAGAVCALLFTSLATLLAGALPAWISSRTQPQEVLHSESRLASESRASKRMRRVLVAVEVAVSVALVLMSGLLSVSLAPLMHIDRGFEADRTITAEIDPPHKSYSDQVSRTSFYKELLERTHQLPGVESVGVVSELPLAGDAWIDMIRVRGDARPFMQIPSEHFRWVSPDYFAALRLPLIAGRFLDAGDQGKRYALISAQTAHSLWPSKNPIGEQFRRAGVPDEAPFRVIGVVGDARTISLAQPDPMMVYMPYWYRSDPTSGLLVRTRQDPAIVADTIRKAIWS